VLSIDLLDVARKMQFPEDPLDHKDRQIIDILFKFKSEGIGFNRLVKISSHFASRSTVALRVQRLVSLGYVEKLQSNGSGRIKPIRLTFKCFTLMHTIEVVSGKIEDLRKNISENLSKVSSQEADQILHSWYTETRYQWNTLFGMVGWIATFYGPTPSGDLFLPIVVEKFRQLTFEFIKSLKTKPDLLAKLSGMLNDRLASSDIDPREVRDQMMDYKKKWNKSA